MMMLLFLYVLTAKQKRAMKIAELLLHLTWTDLLLSTINLQLDHQCVTCPASYEISIFLTMCQLVKTS